MGSKTPSRVRIPQSPPDFTVKKLTESLSILHNSASAPVAQLDRAPGYELGGRRFESFRAHHLHESRRSIAGFFVCGLAGRDRANVVQYDDVRAARPVASAQCLENVIPGAFAGGGHGLV